MRRYQLLSVCAALAVWFVAGCLGQRDEPVPPGGETGLNGGAQPVASETEQYNPAGATMVFLVDTSGSMARFDKRKYAVEVPQVAVAIAGDDDNIGILKFDSYVDVVSKLQAIASYDKRELLQKRINELADVRGGTSEFVDALVKTRKILESVDASPGSAVVFLTDGNPDEGLELAILQEIDRYMRRKWRVYTIGLLNNSQTLIMEQMSARTGGEFYRVSEPEDVLNAYLEIAQTIQNYWYYKGATPETVPIRSGTRRLVYVGIKHALDARLENILRDNQPVQVSPEDWYRYPESPTQRNVFEAINIREPEPGTYHPVVAGDLSVYRILIEPPYKLKLRDGFPQDELYQHDPIQVEVEIAAPDTETLTAFGADATITAEIRRNKTGGLLIDPFPLKPGAIDPETRTMVYSGEKQFSRLSITTEEVFELRVEARVKAGDGGEWVHRFNKKIIYRPTERQRVFALTPSLRELAPVWMDSPVQTTDFTLSMIRGDQAFFDIKLQYNDLASITPTTGDLSALNDSVDLKMTVDPKLLLPGDAQVRFIVTGSNSEGDAPEEVGRVYLPVYKFSAPDSIDVFALRQNLELREGQKTFWPENTIITKPIPIAIQPSAPFSITFLPNENAKDAAAILGLTVEKNPKGFVLKGSVPQIVPAGDYSGSMIIRPVIAGLKERKVPFTLTVDVPTATLGIQEGGALQTIDGKKVLVLTAREPGNWIEANIEMKPSFVYGAKFDYEVTGIYDKNNQEVLSAAGDMLTRSIKVKGTHGKQNWALSNLSEGERYTLTYRAYVSHDLNAGDYLGGIKLRMIRGGETVSEESIRVLLQVINK